MKALRRSLKSSERDKVNHISITPKSAIAIVPPKKVIRALYDYEAQTSQELSFQKGDFFHVIGRENDTDWYEACNPALPDARGLVPVAFFQALGKTERDSTQSEKSPNAVRLPDHDSGYSDTSGSGTTIGTDTARSSKAMGRVNGAMIYGVVVYDFAAERPDELEAKAGEAIIVIAQSNPEWFVAKPIGRLGGPGLIPVSYIEIRDMSSGQAVPDAQEAVQRAGVPKVEEWKRMAADYKNSSITLGKFEVSSSAQQHQQQLQQQQLQQQQQLEQRMDRISFLAPQGQGNGMNQIRQSSDGGRVQPNSYASKSVSQLFAPVSAGVPRYCFAEDKYWFVIEAQLEDGRCWELSRYYEDFYDFQIQLLTEFPVEAGNTGQKRTLPYMPGPVKVVTDLITEGRQHNLDAYVKSLLKQPPYISRCQLVKEFFAPREGDYEMDPNSVNEEYRLSGASQQSSNDSATNDTSRQSLRGNLDGGGGYSGLSATPQRTQSGFGQPSPSLASAMKVKICFGDDLIAIRVPTDVKFQQLVEKIRERLKIPITEDIALFYKDENSGERPSLLSNNDLDFALQRNEKLVVYVQYN